MRTVLSLVALVLTGAVFVADGAPTVGRGHLAALAAAALTEAMGVRLPFFGTVSFGLVVYLPLVCLSQFGGAVALGVAIVAILLREIQAFSNVSRFADEMLLDLLPLSIAALVPTFLKGDEPELLLWLGVGLTFVTTRHLGLRLLSSTLASEEAETAKKLQSKTSEIRWGLLGLSLLAVPLLERSPWMALALVPVLLSQRKAAIHAYAWLDQEDKTRLRAVAGHLSKSLTQAESQIVKLNTALETTESERNLLFEMSQRTAECRAVGDVLVVVAQMANSFRLGRSVELLLQTPNGWAFYKLDEDGRPISEERVFEKVGMGFRKCWKESKSCVSKSTGRAYYPLPGVGVMSVLRPASGLDASQREVVSLLCSQVGLACLSAQRFEMVAQANESLRTALEQLKASEAKLIQSAKLAAVGQLSAGLAHEINNPLGSIQLAIEITLRKETLSDFSRDMLEKALKGVERAQNIIGSLLTYSRSGAKGKVKISAWDVTFDACSFVAASLRVKEVALQLPERGPEATILANPQEMQQIITNLVLNAKDAVEGQANATVRVVAQTTGDGRFQVEVHDSGPGIADGVRERIFEPFFTTKAVGKGTGLGLSVSRELAEAQDGQLEVGTSQLLGGARFVLTVPLA